MANTIRIERLDPIKLPLVKKLYKSYYPSAKAKTDEQVIVAYQEHQMVGLVRFKPTVIALLTPIYRPFMRSMVLRRLSLMSCLTL